MNSKKITLNLVKRIETVTISKNSNKYYIKEGRVIFKDIISNNFICAGQYTGAVLKELAKS